MGDEGSDFCFLGGLGGGSETSGVEFFGVHSLEGGWGVEGCEVCVVDWMAYEDVGVDL